MVETAGRAVMGEIQPAVRELVDRYRARCLWFLESDYYPQSPREVLRVIEYLERHGDQEAFRAAALIRRWLSPTSNVTSAGR